MLILLAINLIWKFVNLLRKADGELAAQRLQAVEVVVFFELLINLLLEILNQKVAPVQENQDSQESLEAFFDFGIAEAV